MSSLLLEKTNGNGTATDRRRTTGLLHIEELTLEPPVRARPQKRTKNRTYSVGEHQERAIAKLAAQLKLDDQAPDCNESELVRVGIEMLLALPRPALLEMIRANKAREEREKYGTGRPRPKSF